MENPFLQHLQASIGKPMTDSPSPFGRWLGGVLTAAQAGELSAEFSVRPEMTNPVGFLHGGVIAGIMDDLIGATVFSLGGEYFYASLNLAVDYIAAVKSGATLSATARIVQRTSNVINAECTLVNGDGGLVARGTSNLVKISVGVKK